MNKESLLSPQLMDDALPLAFVALMAALVVLPAIAFGVARKWSAHQPEIATAALGGAVIVSLVGILAAAFVALAVIGWIPPLAQLLHG